MRNPERLERLDQLDAKLKAASAAVNDVQRAISQLEDDDDLDNYEGQRNRPGPIFQNYKKRSRKQSFNASRALHLIQKNAQFMRLHLPKPSKAHPIMGQSDGDDRSAEWSMIVD